MKPVTPARGAQRGAARDEHAEHGDGLGVERAVGDLGEQRPPSSSGSSTTKSHGASAVCARFSVPCGCGEQRPRERRQADDGRSPRAAAPDRQSKRSGATARTRGHAIERGRDLGDGEPLAGGEDLGDLRGEDGRVARRPRGPDRRLTISPSASTTTRSRPRRRARRRGWRARPRGRRRRARGASTQTAPWRRSRARASARRAAPAAARGRATTARASARRWPSDRSRGWRSGSRSDADARRAWRGSCPGRARCSRSAASTSARRSARRAARPGSGGTRPTLRTSCCGRERVRVAAVDRDARPRRSHEPGEVAEQRRLARRRCGP